MGKKLFWPPIFFLEGQISGVWNILVGWLFCAICNDNIHKSGDLKNTTSKYREEVDKLARNFFSKFCFYIKSVSREATSLKTDLKRLDEYLQQQPAECKYIFGNELTRLDCEVLPKLHHLRVAAFHLKRFEIPPNFTGIWRYLNNAYNDEIFLRTCPPDQEIVLHWASRPDTPSLSYEEYSCLTRYTAKFSFDVPALAIPIVLK